MFMNCTLKLHNHVLMASYISAAHYSTDAQLQATSLRGITLVKSGGYPHSTFCKQGISC